MKIIYYTLGSPDNKVVWVLQVQEAFVKSMITKNGDYLRGRSSASKSSTIVNVNCTFSPKPLVAARPRQ